MIHTGGWLTRPQLGAEPMPIPEGRRARAFLAVITLGFQGLIRLAMGVALARMLGLERYGVFVTAVSFTALLAVVWPGSTGAAVTRFVGQAQGRQQFGEASFWGRQAARLAALSALLATGAGVIGWSAWQGGGFGTSLAVGLLTLGVCLQLFARANNLVVGNYTREAVFGVGTTLLGCAGAVVAAQAGRSTGLVIAVLGAGYMTYAACSWPAVNQERREARDASGTWQMPQYITIVAIGSIASAGFLQAGVIVVGQSAGKTSAGVFGAAMTLATPMALAAAAGSMLLNPTLARLVGSGDLARAARLLRVAGSAYASFFFATLLMFSLVGEALTALMFGENYRAAGPPALALLTGIALTGLAAPSVALLSMGELQNARRTSTYTWIGAGIGTSVWIWSAIAMEGGPMWIAVGFAVGTGVTSLANILRAANVVRSRPPLPSLAILCVPLILVLITT